jgi:hypothetical protein
LPDNSIVTDDFVVDQLNTHYVDILTNTIKERNIQNTVLDKFRVNADGVDFITISDAPLGSSFYAILYDIKAFTLGYEVSGTIEGTETFSTTIPGKYLVKIELFPYIDFETTVEAS